ncbi:nickel pincer cofactor biosynthesis protein LarB [[Eubacterium] cellulosolvens]
MRKILEELKAGKITVVAAEQKLREHFLDVYGIARLDLTRDHRTGVPEVVVAEDKSIEQIETIATEMVKHTSRVIISRLAPELAVEFQKRISKTKLFKKTNIIYHDTAQVCIIRDQKFKLEHIGGKVGIITAGTSDIPIAEEARLIIEELGCETITAYDIGVSGAHRLVEPLKRMVGENVDVLIVLAGREGALPTLIAGIVDIPVIGVPISTGYGIEGKGKTALYAMLQSCSPLVVVNIDAGFVAAAVASRIAIRRAQARTE